jgi:hypothetical protein
MLVAKPLHAFALKDRQIVSCEILLDNPHNFLGKEMWFYTSEDDGRQISIKGLSTASDVERHVYDFHYTGAVILPEEITEHSIISDATYREALGK